MGLLTGAVGTPTTNKELKMYLSITGVENNKLTKYQPFETEAEAVAHATQFNGFVAEDIGGNKEFWVVDKDKKTITHDTATENSVTVVRNAMAEIERLEATVTQRRIRDAIAGTDGGWLANQESLIAEERSKL